MLFVLDKSLAENIDRKDVQRALRYIALGRREGKHLIFCEKRNTMKAFAKYEALGSYTRAIYQYILDRRFSYKKSYYEKLIRYVRVVAEDTVISWRNVGSQKEIKIPAALIDDSAFIQQTILLCENETDCKLYEKMASVYMIWASMENKHGINICYEPRGGGGDTTADQYKAIQRNRRRLCLCLSDSDQKYPNGPIGDTARKLKKIKSAGTLCEHETIGVREIENLIPTAMFSQVSKGNRDRMLCIDFLEKLEESRSSETRQFLDLKSGLSGKDYFDLLSKNQEYWQSFWDTIRPFRMSEIKQGCLNNQTCSSPEKCNCFLFKGLGDKILNDIIKMSVLPTDHKIAEMLNDTLKPYWEKYGELVTAWCCGHSHIS
jgi:hypothetical protein